MSIYYGKNTGFSSNIILVSYSTIWGWYMVYCTASAQPVRTVHDLYRRRSSADSSSKQTVCLTWKQPLDQLLEVVVIAQLVIKCPHVASIKHNLGITSWAVRMMTVVKASLMPANFNKWAVAIGHNPVGRRICYDMQQCCNDTQEACDKRQQPIGTHWSHRHCDKLCANFNHNKQAAASWMPVLSHDQWVYISCFNYKTTNDCKKYFLKSRKMVNYSKNIHREVTLH